MFLHQRYPFWLISIWAAGATALPWLVQPAEAWRDGPEFVVAAWGLGISHPAGYPLYQAIVWMFEQFPLGDIVLRNHSFSAVFTLVSAVLLYEMGISFIRLLKTDNDPRAVHHVMGWISLCWLVMPSQLENAVQSEAYSLFAAFTFLVAKLLFDFLRTQEPRYYVLAVFLAGVGCGNQAMLGAFFFAFLLAPGVFSDIRTVLQTAFSGVLAGMTGLLVYLYLPVRSFQEQSFDWGNAETWARFWAQVSDRKDAASHLEVLAAGTPHADAFFAHMTILHEWFGFTGLLLICVGWIWLLIRPTRASLVAISSVLFLFAVFLGLVSNTVLTGALCILMLGAAVPLVILLSQRSHRAKIAGALFAVSAASAVFVNLYGTGVRFLAGRAEYLPSELVRSQLLALPYRATVLAGPAWFHLRGLEDIEGLRPDVTIIGLGDVISPQYFRPLRPRHIPMLKYPDISQPDIGALPDHEKAEFINQLIFKNADRSQFFLDMDEGYDHVFISYLQPWRGLWWAKLASHPVNNNCSEMGNNIQIAIGRMLQEQQAITDPEFGRFLQSGFFSWSKAALNRDPACLGVAKGMLHWWRRWESINVPAKPGTLHNDMGIVLARMGYLRGARVMFMQADAQGMAEGARNLGVLLLRMGKRKAAMAQFKHVFVEYGDVEAYRTYRKLIHEDTGKDAAKQS